MEQRHVPELARHLAEEVAACALVAPRGDRHDEQARVVDIPEADLPPPSLPLSEDILELGRGHSARAVRVFAPWHRIDGFEEVVCGGEWDCRFDARP